MLIQNVNGETRTPLSGEGHIFVVLFVTKKIYRIPLRTIKVSNTYMFVYLLLQVNFSPDEKMAEGATFGVLA